MALVPMAQGERYRHSFLFCLLPYFYPTVGGFDFRLMWVEMVAPATTRTPNQDFEYTSTTLHHILAA